MTPRSEWQPRSAFAEVAEVLGVRTDLVMACYWRGREATVLWTDDDAEDDPPVKVVMLRRDTDGILRPVSEPQVSGRVSDIIGHLPKEES